MMQHFKVVGLGAATALAAILTCAPVAAALAGDGGHGGERAFELVERNIQETFVDVDNNGVPSPGDTQVFTNDLFRDGKKVGTGGGVCTILSTSDGGEAQCNVTLALKEGQITSQGLLYDVLTAAPSDFDAAITGGTGAFSKARGEIHGSFVSPTEVRLEVHLSH
ncbi:MULTISPECIES: hypothetical protein [unclassified Streptomyces]|uniref:allene oxide cyclase barrel-like domain-containing protein n=1 Tax=unclassified Streptomyces TaxID=2593676 RepID=UPI001BECB334|nr:MULTISPECIES: hypothetical protein [unclassified Streptomyces]MBT2408765.1 hypothetical protein [Streptomyces sp. ISL-21]MBT2613823.1 hypothetical protein [Streptomyces sp. ISL-87]